MIQPFERKEVLVLRNRAEWLRQNTPNPLWQACYAALVLALDHLDAMIARCTVHDDLLKGFGGSVDEDPADWWKPKE